MSLTYEEFAEQAQEFSRISDSLDDGWRVYEVSFYVSKRVDDDTDVTFLRLRAYTGLDYEGSQFVRGRNTLSSLSPATAASKSTTRNCLLDKRLPVAVVTSCRVTPDVPPIASLTGRRLQCAFLTPTSRDGGGKKGIMRKGFFVRSSPLHPNHLSSLFPSSA